MRVQCWANLVFTKCNLSVIGPNKAYGTQQQKAAAPDYDK